MCSTTSRGFASGRSARMNCFELRYKKIAVRALASESTRNTRLILMSNLTALLPSKKRQTFCMLCGSLIFHSVLVGAAALWIQPEPVSIPASTVDMDFEPAGPSIEAASSGAMMPSVPPTLELPVPLPPDAVPPEDEPPSAPDQEITEPPRTKPATPPRSKPIVPARPHGGSAPSRSAQTSASTQGAGSGDAAGITGMGSGPAGWRIPKPAYTFALRGRRLQGVARIRVTTGSNGRVVDAVIIKSTGSAALDENTVASVRANWSGPPKASAIREVEYRLQ